MERLPVENCFTKKKEERQKISFLERPKKEKEKEKEKKDAEKGWKK